jgi:hypothetical protein
MIKAVKTMSYLYYVDNKSGKEGAFINLSRRKLESSNATQTMRRIAVANGLVAPFECPVQGLEP